MPAIPSSPDELARLSDEALRRRHAALHRLYRRYRDRGRAIEDLVNAHMFLLEEMASRGIPHEAADELDRLGMPNPLPEAAVPPWLRERIEGLPEELLLVPDFLSIAGSAVVSDRHNDVDVVVRLSREDSLLPSVAILARKALDPDKSRRDLHIVPSPAGPHSNYLPLYDLVLRRRDLSPVHRPLGVVRLTEAVRPGSRFSPMKPRMAGSTEAFTPDEIWGWVKEQLEEGRHVVAEPKLDGFRVVVSKGREGSVWFEDSREDRSRELPELLRQAPEGTVLDGELVFVKGDHVLPRTQLASALAGRVPGASPRVYVFDLLYHEGEDLSELPLSERRRRLESLNLKGPYVVVPQRSVTDRRSLEAAFRWGKRQEASEGIVLKVLEAPYAFGGSDAWAKVKAVTPDLKVVVLARDRKQGGWVYTVGLRDDMEELTNPRRDGYLVLGKTFATRDVEAKEGDTINVRAEEVLLLREGDRLRLSWGKPTPVGLDRSRGPYLASQVVDIARRAGLLKEEAPVEEVIRKEGSRWVLYTHDLKRVLGTFKTYKDALKRLRQIQFFKRMKEAVDLEEDDLTHSEAASRFWQENWWRMYPEKGGGHFVLHAHVRGLSEDEVELPLNEMLRRGRSVHYDLRLESDDRQLFGFTIFAGEPEENVGLRQLRLMAQGERKLQGTFKLAQPHAWLNVGEDGPAISEPGRVGATSRKYAAFFVVDRGRYRAGVWREHFFELFLRGKLLSGRFIVTYAPVGGRRIWLISRPEDQRPYAATHDLDEVVAELRAKGQKHLLWSDGKSAAKHITL